MLKHVCRIGNCGAAWCSALLVLTTANVAAQNPATNSRALTPYGNPFLKLLQDVELPPSPRDVAGAVSSEIDMGEINPSLLAGSRLALFSQFGDLEGLYQFESRPNKPQGADEWQVFVARPPNSDPSSNPVIGSGNLFAKPMSRIFMKSNRLCFQWNPDNVTRYNGQLANVIIELKSGKYSHSIRLRRLLKKDAIELDLTQNVIRIPLILSELPRTESLAFIVNGVEYLGSELGPSFHVLPISRQAMIGKDIVLTRADAVDTEIRLTLIGRKSGSELQIRTSYKSADDRERPFDAERIMLSQKQLARTLSEGRVKLARAKAAAPRFQSELNAMKARVPQNAEERTRQQADLTRLKANVRRALSTIRRYSRSLPKLEASLAAMEDLASVGESLHKNVRFHVTVIATQQNRTLELVRFGDAKVQRGSGLASTP